MVYMVFYAKGEDVGNSYFVGDSPESILADTDGGASFAGMAFEGHAVCSAKEVEALGFDSLANGRKAVSEPGMKSFWLGIR